MRQTLADIAYYAFNTFVVLGLAVVAYNYLHLLTIILF